MGVDMGRAIGTGGVESGRCGVGMAILFMTASRKSTSEFCALRGRAAGTGRKTGWGATGSSDRKAGRMSRETLSGIAEDPDNERLAANDWGESWAGNSSAGFEKDQVRWVRERGLETDNSGTSSSGETNNGSGCTGAIGIGTATRSGGVMA